MVARTDQSDVSNAKALVTAPLLATNTMPEKIGLLRNLDIWFYPGRFEHHISHYLVNVK